MNGKQLFLPVLPLPPKLLENLIGGLSLSLAVFQTPLGKVELEKVESALVLVLFAEKTRGPDRGPVHVPLQQDQTNSPTVPTSQV